MANAGDQPSPPFVLHLLTAGVGPTRK